MGICQSPHKARFSNNRCVCGYCTPGFLISSKSLLDKNPKPTEDGCKWALAGNICGCGTYPRHPTAIMEASSQIMKGAQHG